jgi:hypothetical protein
MVRARRSCRGQAGMRQVTRSGQEQGTIRTAGEGPCQEPQRDSVANIVQSRLRGRKPESVNDLHDRAPTRRPYAIDSWAFMGAARRTGRFPQLAHHCRVIARRSATALGTTNLSEEVFRGSLRHHRGQRNLPLPRISHRRDDSVDGFLRNLMGATERRTRSGGRDILERFQQFAATIRRIRTHPRGNRAGDDQCQGRPTRRRGPAGECGFPSRPLA